MSTTLPLLYTDLASWWPLLSAPEDYAEEAVFFRGLLRDSGVTPSCSLLELGSGGGNMATHLKRDLRLTLVDLSPGMLAVSKALNPECEHILGDMRTVRLGRTFDAVLIHDAIDYMTTEADLKAALTTAAVHCREGGTAVFAPDYIRENFKQSAHESGGHDSTGRALRYLEWDYDPDPSDTQYRVDYAYLLREADGTVRAVHDQHDVGLFYRADWLRLLAEVGFEAQSVQDRWGREVFVAVKRRSPNGASRQEAAALGAVSLPSDA